MKKILYIVIFSCSYVACNGMLAPTATPAAPIPADQEKQIALSYYYATHNVSPCGRCRTPELPSPDTSKNNDCSGPKENFYR